MPASFSPSVVDGISDLDGFSVTGDSCYSQMRPSMYVDNAGDFGFDPPARHATYSSKAEQTYSPPEDSSPFGDFDLELKSQSDHNSSVRSLNLERMISQTSPTVISRYGQVTPPRSNSESSSDKPVEQKQTKQKRATKSSVKEDQPGKPAPASRRRRNTRKNSTATTGSAEEDEKRKQSLEKNRLAAAKCRVNKKEKTEQLQRDSHDKAVQNALLKEQVMRMKEEVQQMNAVLLAHANCDGCKSSEDIQKHLNNLGNEFLAQHMSGVANGFPGFEDMPNSMSEINHDHYFAMMNPPLPDFDREPDFDVSTPMHTD